jgi:mono/diheme cytochrome c family protein
MMPQRLMDYAAVFLIALPLAVFGGANPGQQETRPEAPEGRINKRPAQYTPPSSGKAMYLAYCSSCHGKDGKGDGPAASAMKIAPSDLTEVAAKNGGIFPENHVAQTIKGDSNTPSHGSKDMPVWGPIFGAIGTKSEGVPQLRLRNLTKYIESLQQK